MADPLFTVVITTFNRAGIAPRCIDSCLTQSFEDFQLVVVDDASTDDTVGMLAAYDDPRLETVVHPENRGISSSRHTGVAHARGEWIVVLDSDWELVPNTLGRLSELIDELPDGVRVLRSRLLWDDGLVTPHFVPAGPYGYEGRIRWVEEEGGWDAGRCFHRSVFERTPYIEGRRGAQEMLWELDLASRETSVCVDEVLGREHDDAPNSWLRTADSKELGRRLAAEAPDMLWMAETALAGHEQALRRFGPGQLRTFLRVAATQAFLLGRRRDGARHALRALRLKPLDPMAWTILVLGLCGPRFVVAGTVGLRRLRAGRD